jgi:hypothetical protein
VQHVIPDDRIMETPRTDLWRAHGTHQVYITEAHTEVLKPGPGLTFAAEVPDMHHYNGRGGRVLPLYASTDHSRPNLAPGLLELLGSRLGSPVAPEDLAAYIAGVTGHPAFTATFTDGIYAAPPRPTARWPMASALPGVLHFATHARAGAPGWRRVKRWARRPINGMALRWACAPLARTFNRPRSTAMTRLQSHTTPLSGCHRTSSSATMPAR